MISEYFKYYKDKRLFKLVKIEGYMYVFECGHRVTDNVFEDLIRVKTGIANYENNQLELTFDVDNF